MSVRQLLQFDVEELVQGVVALRVQHVCRLEIHVELLDIELDELILGLRERGHAIQ